MKEKNILGLKVIVPNIVLMKKHETSGNTDQVSAKQQAGKKAGRGANGRRGIASIDVC